MWTWAESLKQGITSGASYFGNKPVIKLQAIREPVVKGS